MASLNKFKNFIGLAALLVLIGLALPVRAQEPNSGIASTYPIIDRDVLEGDLLCFSTAKGGLVRCSKAYDETLFGVYAERAQIVLQQGENTKPVLTAGRVTVNVTTINGPIKAGDTLTSSAVPGEAEKATEPIGYIVGRALADFSGEGGKVINIEGTEVRSGQVAAALTIGPQGVLPRGTLLDQLGYILVKGTQTPQAAGIFLRYVMAGILTVSVTIFALNNFGRNITKGIESIGRNPLARGQIQLAIIINSVLIISLVVGSIILGLVIIRI